MWHDRCALARCTDEACQDLQGYAFDRFQQYLRKIEPGLYPPKAADAWHAFESHLALGRSRTAKAWKQWLFARGGKTPGLDCIQGGATLIMRDVVRDYLRREYAPDWMHSLDAPVKQEASSTTLALGDLLADPQDPLAVLEQKECEELAKHLAERASNLLTHRQSIALLAYQKGKALNHPAVLQAAQCGKSSLCNALHQALHTLARMIQSELPGETPDTRVAIAGLLIAKISEKILISLERQDAHLFRYIKEESEYGH